MIEVTNPTQAIARLSTLIPRTLGFSIQNCDTSGEKSALITLQHEDSPELKLYIAATRITETKNLVIYLSENDHQSLTHSIYYGDADASLTAVKLPTTDEKLDALYHDFEGDWDTTFVGKTFKRMAPGKIQSSDVKKFCEVLMVPTFDASKEAVDPSFRKQLVKGLSTVLGSVILFPKLNTSCEGHSHKSHLQEPEGEAKSGKLERDLKDSSKDVELPSFDDEYELKRNLRNDSSTSKGVPSIGDDDLYGPVGKYPEMRPGMTAQGSHNGMIVDKTHPLFAGRIGSGSGFPSGMGDAPPGARYDDPFGQASSDPSAGLGLPNGAVRRPFGGPGAFGGPFGGGPPGFGGGFI